jgi:hypothetical protein
VASRVIDAVDVERRIQFVIQEARQSKPWYDQTVIYALRVATNFYCINKNGGSSLVYRQSRYRSAKAHELILSGEWQGKLLNEHQEPLREVWRWLCDEGGNVSIKQVEERLRRWPMVVITRDENSKIPKNEKDPKHRYRDIAVLYRNDSGEWITRSDL